MISDAATEVTFKDPIDPAHFEKARDHNNADANLVAQEEADIRSN